MKLDITNITVVLVATGLGFYCGISQNNSTSFDLLDVLGLIVSIAVLITANRALFTWKNQFKHQEQYKALINVESAFRKYCNSEISYWGSCLEQYRKDGYVYELPTGVEFKNRREAYVQFTQSWDELIIHIPNFEIKYPDITPEKVQREFMDLVVKSNRADFDLLHGCPDGIHNIILVKNLTQFRLARANLS